MRHLTWCHLLPVLILLLGLTGSGPVDADSDGTGDVWEKHSVCSVGCDFTSIQAAVDFAQSGDTIGLGAETFYETVSVTEKSLTIRGAGPENTVVDGGGEGSVFGIRGGSCEGNCRLHYGSSDYRTSVAVGYGHRISCCCQVRGCCRCLPVAP